MVEGTRARLENIVKQLQDSLDKKVATLSQLQDSSNKQATTLSELSRMIASINLKFEHMTSRKEELGNRDSANQQK